MIPNDGQWFEQEPTEEESEYKLPGDAPVYVKGMNYVPKPVNYNNEFTRVSKLPGVSLGAYYGKKKRG